MNLEGKLLGNRYEIIEKIGNGGMATVYKAKCHVLNRYVAVKVLREEFTTDEEFIKRFAAEAQSAASLTHPNIVSIYDVGNEGNLYYIVMELIKGKTLKEIINEDGALSWKWSVNIAIQIASALETAHRNNIIHRDIKPHNIIITEDGIAKVTDFGIAKVVSNSTVTAFGTTIGSVHYFSPEHARGGFTDAKSDLYSLGVVMYEMLTGKVPFDADTPVSIALKHMQEEPVEPIELNPEIPTAVNKIILKAMKKDSNLRYTSATEMLKDLNLALKNPDGNFVFMKGDQNDFPTRKIPIYDNMMEDEKKRNNTKKENKLVSWIKKHKKVSMVIGGILLFFLAFGGTALYIDLTTADDVQIPNLVGMTKEEMEQELSKLKLEYEISTEEYNEQYEAGKIISQDPPYIADYKIKEKSTIKVVISKGTQIVKVTKVTGKTRQEAISELESLGLKVEEVEEISKKVEEGYVIKQSPEADKEVSSGSTVTITVSKGDGIVKTYVPGVTGKKEAEAKEALNAANLKVNVAYEEDDTKEDGEVLRQSIESGKEVAENTTITITVNKKVAQKTATIHVNVKKMTGGYEVEDNTIGETNKKVTVEVKSNDVAIFTRSGVDKNNTAITTSVSGKSSITVTVTIKSDTGSVIASNTQTVDFSKAEYNFE